ncbi:sensor histidine kinase [Umezawaea tangerina]|uniref:Oxygen sensor histidine kinase NreB n=1 Tax=Umezawaea tangerina TaxID=84725 RepID=A0A2T0T3Y2_9PSEU|nr:sensor histidine kinase [Umezawaea tangerina]PRY40343.1 signal transduction histidine kinase [Umezawaea tangerina]
MAETALDRWERRMLAVGHVIPYFVLTVTTALYLVLSPHDRGAKLISLAVVAFTYAWMFWWFTAHPKWRTRQGLMAVFIIGMLVLYGYLGLRETWFGAVSFAVYVYAGEVLKVRWMFVAVATTAVLATMSLFGGVPSGPEFTAFLIFGLLFVTIACTFTFVGHVTTEQSRKRKEMVAQLAATMEENAGLHAQLLVQAREAGMLDERQRMAREIHDTLAQGFTGIITQLEAAEQTGDWRARVATATRLARENLTEARRSVHALRPAPLANAALPEALAEVVEGWRGATGVPVEVTTTGTARPMHPEVEVALLRTAQEALANVAKHAAASRVGLTLSYMEDVVTLDVRDDGVGFDPGATGGEGFGLMTMRQRVSRLAGAFEVESEPGLGTAVSASVPAIPTAVTT